MKKYLLAVGMSRMVRALILPLVLIAITVMPGISAAQENEIYVSPPDTTPIPSDAIAQALSAAQTMANDGISTMNEDTLRHAAAAYEQIIQDFPNDERHFDAFFASAYIHMEYLQGVSDYEHAANLLKLLINNHPSNDPEVTDAYLTLAHLYYRCTRDYRSAQECLSELLRHGPIALLSAYSIEVNVKLSAQIWS